MVGRALQMLQQNVQEPAEKGWEIKGYVTQVNIS